MKTSTCKACGVQLVFQKTAGGKFTPMSQTSDGKWGPHWATCTKPEQFRKRAAKK